MTDKTTDKFGPDDIPESRILKIEEYMDNHAKEIVDFVERKISEKRKKDIKITGQIPNRIMNELVKEMPFGPTLDWTHIILADALMSSLWCGWLSQSMVLRKEPKFKEEYVEQYKRAITKAYDTGRRQAKRPD
jgi:hypothetical protein